MRLFNFKRKFRSSKLRSQPVHHLICLLCKFSFVVFILFYFVRAFFTQTLNFKITIYAIHAEIQTKVNFMGSIFCCFSSFLYL